MLSNRPYLLRAFHQWIVDSVHTPILVINANYPRCKVPMEYAEDGEIVFNVAPSAIRDIKISNELVEFKASFSGVIHIIAAPIKAILAIYAEENGEGIFFDAEEESDMDGGVVSLRSIEGSKRSFEQDLPPSDQVIVKKNKPVLTLIE